jgi:polyphosphate kinase
MPRNLDTRVELLAPVRDEGLRRHLEETMDLYFADDTFAWELDPDGDWTRRNGGTRVLHDELMERTLERVRSAE